MKLFKHNYLNLSEQDKAILERWNKKYKAKSEMTVQDFLSDLSNKYYGSQTIQSYISLFPNNYLHFIKFTKNYKSFYKKKLDDFINLLNDNNTTERQLLNYIKETESYFIVSSLLKYTDFGHHDAYIFPEFQLGSKYKPDYLVIGKNSHGYHFLFIELENPYGNIVQKDGSLGLTFRKGINQIEDWSIYLEKNFHIIKTVLEDLKSPHSSLPEEFYNFDITRMFFAVVAGRRGDFTEKTYRLKRKTLKNQGTLLLHYDNLIDKALNTIEYGKVSV